MESLNLKQKEMLVEVVKSKIHRVTVTQADLNYIGSITIDEDLMDAANISSIHQILINRNTTDIIQIGLRDRNPVYFRFYYLYQHFFLF